MKVYKFGGASVKDAEGIRNVANILNTSKNDKVLVVISALGKTTNALEKVVSAIANKTGQSGDLLAAIKQYHLDILMNLQMNSSLAIQNEIENLFLELDCIAEYGFEGQPYDFIYDQVVTFGELLSTKIVSYYLLGEGIKNQWIDSRNFIITDARHRDAKVKWVDCEHMIGKRLKPLAEKNLIITQGFMGKGPSGETTTLGREGSDYSAAIFTYCLDAESLTIWKDVDGLMNADPRKFEDAQLISEISYRDTIELAYYGASVIHPKTMQPLQAKEIPLNVKSFLNPEKKGTLVHKSAVQLETACFIHKENQMLISCRTKDFTFIVEDQLSQILALLAKEKMHVGIMQNSALSFMVTTDDRQNKDEIIAELEVAGFRPELKSNLQMLTVYNSSKMPASLNGKTILMQQQTDTSAHYLYE